MQEKLENAYLVSLMGALSVPFIFWCTLKLHLDLHKFAYTVIKKMGKFKSAHISSRSLFCIIIAFDQLIVGQSIKLVSKEL